MNCPECETTLTSGARFCHRCGWDSKLASAGRTSSTVAQRPAWKRWVTGISLGFFSFLVLMLLLIPRGDSQATLTVGEPAPDFTLTTLTGQQIRLSDLRGRPVVVNFWATWCTPCRREMPDFQAIYDREQGNGLAVLGVNVGESRIGVSEFVQSLNLSFPILIDERETVQVAYKILPLPATFFIDRAGVIRGIYQFQMSRMQMETEVQRILAR